MSTHRPHSSTDSYLQVPSRKPAKDIFSSDSNDDAKVFEAQLARSRQIQLSNIRSREQETREGIKAREVLANVLRKNQKDKDGVSVDAAPKTTREILQQAIKEHHILMDSNHKFSMLYTMLQSSMHQFSREYEMTSNVIKIRWSIVGAVLRNVA